MEETRKREVSWLVLQITAQRGRQQGPLWLSLPLCVVVVVVVSTIVER